MGMMARMRSLAPWFIITVGGVFVLFMVLSDSKVTDMIGQRSQFVGQIDGMNISYQQFTNLVENEKQNIERQNNMTFPETQVPGLRDRIWDNLITETAIEKAIDDYGIVVTDQEIKDILLAENPPQFLKKDFVDSTGNFNRDAYMAAIYNPQNRENLIYIEEMLRQQKRREKLQSYISSAITVSEEEIRKEFVRNNTKMDMTYARITQYSIEDTTILATEDDAKEFYNNNKEEYKKDPTRKLKYVTFVKEATAQDTADILENLVEIKKQLIAEPDNFKTFVEIYSSQEYKVDTLASSNFETPVVELLKDAEKNSIVGPVLLQQGGYALFKKLDEFKTDEPQVNAAHILIKGSDDEAKKKADELYKELINGADFAQLALENSDDASAQTGGELGWFTKGTMVDAFWDASVNARIGRVTKPVKTRFGYHIILVKERNYKGYIVESIFNKIEISPRSVEKLYNDANDFAYLADKEGFEKIAEELGYSVVESNFFQESASFVSGLGMVPAAVKFAFENSVGDVSKVFNTANGYAVTMVAEKKSGGYKEFDEVKSNILAKLNKERKLEKAIEIAKEVKEKIEATGNFESAKEIYPRAIVSEANDFNGTGVITGIGKEFAVSETAMEIEVGKISNPIKTANAAVIIKVTDRTEVDETEFAVQKAEIKTKLMNEKQNQYFAKWLQSYKDQIEVVDNRYEFFF